MFLFQQTSQRIYPTTQSSVNLIIIRLLLSYVLVTTRTK